MTKYNIYKIDKSKEPALLKKFEEVQLSSVGKKLVDGLTLSLFFSKTSEDIPVWWVRVYQDYLPSDKELKNKAHFAVFVISGPAFLYAVSMGKSHFYLKDFCDSGFGINLAERIADSNNLKLKHSILQGRKKNKSISSYQENSELEFEAGESILYVKTKTTDLEKWGGFVSFGNSAQFHLKITPNELPKLIKAIEEELQKEPKLRFPRLKIILDKELIAKLDQKLVHEILNSDNARIQSAEAVVSGVEFIFLDQSQYRLIFNRHRQDVDELSLDILGEFINQHRINLAKNINKIKIGIFSEHGTGHAKTLKYFLDYSDDEGYLLVDGKWHVFNQDYIEFLKDEIDKRIFFENSSINFSDSSFEQWKNSPGFENSNVRTPEQYFNFLQEQDGYENLDGKMETLQKKFSIEKLDLYKDGTAFFVKIGKPQKLGYVIDQATATIKMLQSRTLTNRINGQNKKIEGICLWLILDRQTKITRVSEIKSIILLVKLSEWQRQCTDAGYRPIVRIGYRQD